MGSWSGHGRAGSIVLLIAASVVLLRPWEGIGEATSEPRSATALVTRVVDGDTIEVRLGGRREDIRYIGVDTPETVEPGAPAQCFGHRASRFNRRLVGGRRVRLVFGIERHDAYGRLLAYVYVDHRFVNAELVRRGLARKLSIPPNTLHGVLFERLEIAASGAGRGLWGACPT
jgi:micrococcal nuclease